MKYRYTVLVLIQVLISCSKQDNKSNNQITTKFSGYHIDNILNDDPGGSNHTLLLAEIGDKSTFISVGGRNYTEANSLGFRIMNISKKDGLRWIKTYYPGAQYDIQPAYAATIDPQQNIWTGGYLFGGNNNFGKPFIVKTDVNGNILFSGYIPFTDSFNSPQTYRLQGIKALSNGDVLVVVSGTYLQFMRLNSNGSLVWMEKASIGNMGVMGLMGGHNNIITESAAGDIFISGSDHTYTGLIKLRQDGSFVFAKHYQTATDNTVDYSQQIITLPTGELLISGNRYNLKNSLMYPFFLKLNPSNGQVIGASQAQEDLLYGRTFLLNDIQYVNNQFKVTYNVGSQYNTVTMDNTFTALNYGRTLGLIGGFGGISTLFYDGSDQSLYHMIDTPGPGANTGFQLIKTDLSGVSCHGYTSTPTSIPLSSFSPTVVDVPGTVTATTCSFVPMNLQVNTISDFSKNVVCN